jgi:hypothetical protein
MPTAPSLISYTEVAYNGTGASRASASISWLANDVIAVLSGSESATGGPPGVPTATGLTFTSQKSNNAASSCSSRASAAVAAGSGSSAVTVTLGDITQHWGFSVWVYRGSDGIGNSSEEHTTAKTVSQTNTAANSAVVWAGFDFGANAITNNNLTPTPTNTNEQAVDAGRYTAYVADLTDQTSAGSVAYGVSGAGTIGTFSKLVLEIKGLSGAPSVTPSYRKFPKPRLRRAA